MYKSPPLRTPRSHAVQDSSIPFHVRPEKRVVVDLLAAVTVSTCEVGGTLTGPNEGHVAGTWTRPRERLYAVPRVLLASLVWVFGCRRGNVAVRGSTKVEAVAEHEKVRFWFLSMDHLSFSCLRTSYFFASGLVLLPTAYLQQVMRW